MEQKSLAEVGYEAYRSHSGGKSLKTGEPIPSWAELPDTIRDGWAATAGAIKDEFLRIKKEDDAPCPNPRCAHCRRELSPPDIIALSIVSYPLGVRVLPFMCRHCNTFLTATYIPPARQLVQPAHPAFSVPQDIVRP